MRAWLRIFWEIVRWQSGPRDLPASAALLRWTVVGYLLTSWLQAAMVYGLSNAHWLSLGDLALTVAVSTACLLPSRWPRVPQTLAAVLGAGALLSVPMSGLLLLRSDGATDSFSALLTMASLPLLVWSGLVMARILSQAMDKPLAVGVGITLIYFSLSYWLLAPLSQRMGG